MKTTNVLTGIAMMALTGLAACATGSEGADSSTGAVSTAGGLVSGHYGPLDIVVGNGVVSGHYYDQVGDPAQGGATCEFTFFGKVYDGASSLILGDGYETVTADLAAVKSGATIKDASVKLKLYVLPNACARVAPELADGVELRGDKAMEAGTLGYRSVAAPKAHFHDTAGGAARAAYVVQGDTVTVLGAEANGYVKVSYAGPRGTTTGFLSLVDLGPTSFDADATTRIVTGRYLSVDGDGAKMVINGPCSSDNTITRGSGETIAQGALGEDQHTISAPEGDVCGQYTLFQRQPNEILVKWKEIPGLSVEAKSACRSAELVYSLVRGSAEQACP